MTNEEIQHTIIYEKINDLFENSKNKKEKLFYTDFNELEELNLPKI